MTTHPDHPVAELVPTPRVDLAKPAGDEVAARRATWPAHPVDPQTGRIRATARVLWRRPLPAQIDGDLPPTPALLTAGRETVRVMCVTGLGLVSWADRATRAATHGIGREAVRTARAAGDRETLDQERDRLREEKNDRMDRLAQLPKVVGGMIVVAGMAIGGLLLLALLLGVVAFSQGGPAGWTGWWAGVGATIATTWAILGWAWWAAGWVGPPTVLVLAYREGARRAGAPRWLRTSGDDDVDLTIDETTIAAALGALRIPQITQHFKSGLPLQYLTPARVDGRGTHAVVRLPPGVSAVKIARRRSDLATGLHRLAKEVWPTTGSEEGILDLWVADKGALNEGAGIHPLLEDGTASYFKGFPFGRTLRGVPVTVPMMGRNTIIGGMPEQGKSNAARNIAVGATLDVTTELRIWIPDTNFDFEHFRPRCSRYVMGAEREHMESIVAGLRELKQEIQIRGQLLVDYGIAEVNADIATRNVGLHPIVAILEEAHVAITDDEYGSEISGLLVDIVRLGRKRAIHMVPSTQAPTKDSMPRQVTRNCSNGVAFAVGDHVPNDALLGQGAYAAGHRATELIPGTDRGTAVVKGFTGQRSDMVQVYFVHVDDVPAIVDRGLDAIARAGRAIPGSGRSAAALVERDLLEDLDAVLGTEPLPVADVASLLSAHAPGWAPYRAITGKALRARLLDHHGVKVPSTGNRWPLDPATVRAALTRRDRGELPADGWSSDADLDG